ncbi:MAG: pyrroline-5-carboxylate reductase [Candidatus Saganbacteria bacterium]|nr:pyrroline-5-carboxylate reductase [Candidatus Saganbacteria bacterium]
MKIAFIGAGKMAEALIARLTDRKNIVAADVSRARLRFLSAKYKVKALTDNRAAFASAEVVILAVKPQQLTGVLDELNSNFEFRISKLFISIAAGIPLSYLQKKLPGHSVIRAMPNNPCLVGAGMTALAKGGRVTGRELRIARKIFEQVGEVVTVPEKWLDAVTGLSGSGPAYVYQLIEAMTAGGARLGLPRKLAAKLAVQTVFGAAAAVKATGREPAELRAMVTSPGGTTIEGLNVLARRRFSGAVIEAIAAAAKKSRALARQWAV